MFLKAICKRGALCNLFTNQTCLPARQALLIMKFTAIFLFAAALQVSAKGNAQQVTLSLKDAPIVKAFQEIERQTGYSFVYSPTLVVNAPNVSLEVKNMNLSDVLTLCFKDQPLTYTLRNKFIVVKLKNTIPKKKEDAVPMADALVNLEGLIQDEFGTPIVRATINIISTQLQTITDDNGEFSLKAVDENAVIRITCIGYEPVEVKVNGRKEIVITMKTDFKKMEHVQVRVNTGFQKIATARTPGSYVYIDKALLSRNTGSTLLERLDGVVPSLLSNKNINPGTNQSQISIRGRSTIFANPNPLIVIDNFLYTGDLNNINPNDVESVTILRDPVAASIWGAYSGNGVIVITTRKGSYNQPLRVSASSTITMGEKPDIFYTPFLTSNDFIDVELFAFSKGYYQFNPNTPLSPVVELLFKKQNGQISAADADAQINALRSKDVRNDLQKYFYRNSLGLQNHVDFSGGNPSNQYYFSVGYNKNLQNLVRNQDERLTINARNTIKALKNKLEITASTYFSKSKVRNNNAGIINSPINSPYLSLVDNNGNASVIPNNYRQSWKDTVGGGRLLDWNYRPLDELKFSDQQTDIVDYRVDLGLNYKIVKGLQGSLFYRYNKGVKDNNNYFSQETYYTRNMINEISSLNYQTGVVARPIPLGGIMDVSNNSYEGNFVRGQLNYSRVFKSIHEITAVIGSEINSIVGNTNNDRMYGYNKDLNSFSNVDYNSFFTSNITSASLRITSPKYILQTIDRFLNYFANASYSYNQRYTVSASIRKDESNIFGVATNQKGVPLWSTGLSWNIDREKFYKISWLPYLKLRGTYGYTGNIDKTLSAYTTASVGPGTNNWGAIVGSIVNPSNDSLRWEKVRMINTGLEFSLKNQVLTGSIDFFFKKGTDMIGQTPLDPTSGVALFKGNVADIKGHGFDISLNSKNITTEKVQWTTNLNVSHAIDKIDNYKAKLSTINGYLSSGLFNPLEGYPVYSVFSLAWGGLDASGNPVGIVNKQPSTDYISILTSKDFSSLIYNGPATPTFFGNLRNNLSFKQLTFSLNITYRLGYYFRANSVNYNQLFSGFGHPDYLKRWQNPGDENRTSVPSMIYPLNGNRDNFYQLSEVLVQKGDHIRLSDIQVAYSLSKRQWAKFPFETAQITFYANNLGLLWKANNKGIDPDYFTAGSIPLPKTYSLQFKVDF